MASHRPKSQSSIPGCPCLPLHERCNPVTCHKSPNRKKRKRQPPKAESPDSPWAVECALSAFRVSALQGCFTCGIYYAGLSMPGCFIHQGNEDDVQVQIKGDGAHVSAYNRANNFVYDDLEFYTVKESDFRSSCQLFSTPNLSMTPQSEESFQDIKEWIAECQTHPRCQNSDSDVLPTRVLDVGTESNPVPYLFEPRGFKEDYVTLSHCWGEKHIVTTTKESLTRRKEGIEVSLLPKTFSDAILITRKLRFRYLWIDSLCIIQDDEADWQLESKKMAKIYENSALTISASAAHDAEYGCFFEAGNFGGHSSWAVTVTYDFGISRGGFAKASSSLPHIPVRHPITDDNQFRIRKYYGSKKEKVFSDRGGGNIVAIFRPSTDNPITLHLLPKDRRPEDDAVTSLSTSSGSASGIFIRKQLQHTGFSKTGYCEPEELPLLRRAWAFQERLLSPRVLHYTTSELIWECKTTSKCQCSRILSQRKGGIGVPALLASPQSTPTLKSSFASFFARNPTSQELIYQWTEIVYHYSHKRLSHDADRLPALSGLAQRFFICNLGTYAAGLWEKHLPTQLIWKPWTSERLRTRSLNYTAPTWSWASLNVAIYFLSGIQSGGAMPQSTRIVGTVLEVHCTPSGLDPLGSIVDGYLRVRGQLVEATLEITANNAEAGRKRIQESNTYNSLSGQPSPPYLFRIVNDTLGSEFNFAPDSVSDIDVLTPRQPVFCLLWSVPLELDPAVCNNARHFITILALRPSKRLPGNYERIGLLNRHMKVGIKYYTITPAGSKTVVGDTSRMATTNMDNSPALKILKWFSGVETVDITIV